MKLIKISVIIAIQIIFNCLNASGQTIETAVIGNDTVFVMNRRYAELVAARFDSLRLLKRSFYDCNNAVDGLQFSIIERAELIKAQNNLIGNLRDDIEHQNDIIHSFERTQVITDDIKKQLFIESRKKKFWRVSAFILLGAGVGSSIYFLTR
jgi:hypothetical protein